MKVTKKNVKELVHHLLKKGSIDPFFIEHT